MLHLLAATFSSTHGSRFNNGLYIPSFYEGKNAIVFPPVSDVDGSENSLESISTALTAASNLLINGNFLEKKLIFPVVEEQRLLFVAPRNHWVTLHYDPSTQHATLIDSRSFWNSFWYPTAAMQASLVSGLNTLGLRVEQFDVTYQSIQDDQIRCGAWTAINIELLANGRTIDEILTELTAEDRDYVVRHNQKKIYTRKSDGVYTPGIFDSDTPSLGSDAKDDIDDCEFPDEPNEAIWIETATDLMQHTLSNPNALTPALIAPESITYRGAKVSHDILFPFSEVDILANVKSTNQADGFGIFDSSRLGSGLSKRQIEMIVQESVNNTALLSKNVERTLSSIEKKIKPGEQITVEFKDRDGVSQKLFLDPSIFFSNQRQRAQMISLIKSTLKRSGSNGNLVISITSPDKHLAIKQPMKQICNNGSTMNVLSELTLNKTSCSVLSESNVSALGFENEKDTVLDNSVYNSEQFDSNIPSFSSGTSDNIYAPDDTLSTFEKVNRLKKICNNGSTMNVLSELTLNNTSCSVLSESNVSALGFENEKDTVLDNSVYNSEQFDSDILSFSSGTSDNIYAPDDTLITFEKDNRLEEAEIDQGFINGTPLIKQYEDEIDQGLANGTPLKKQYEDEIDRGLASGAPLIKQHEGKIDSGIDSSAPYEMSISMQVLGGFIAVLGCAAVATAFIFLNAATAGVAGLIVAGLGVACIVAGVGLFATSTYKKEQAKPGDSLGSSNLEINLNNELCTVAPSY
jgi:hypothetical protein